MEWYDKWKGHLPYPVEELHYADGSFRTLIVSNKAIKEAEKLVEEDNIEGRTYYIIGSRGIGKSTTLNYMMRRNLDDHREKKTAYQEALFLLCPIPRTVSPNSARELAYNIMRGVLNGIVQTLQQEEVVNYLKEKYPEILTKTTKIIQEDIKKSKSLDPTDIVNRILSIFSESYSHIFILVDDLDKTEDVNLALKALWSYQATFNDWKRNFRVILVISGKEEWVYAFDDLAEYSGIKGSEIILNDWEAEEAKSLVQKRLALLEIMHIPLTDDAFYELIKLGVISPRGILTTCEKILNKAARLKISHIGPPLINETLYWNRKRIKDLKDFNISRQENWGDIRKSIYKNQDLEEMGFGILIETISRKNLLPMDHPSFSRNSLPRLKVLKKDRLNKDVFFHNLKELEKFGLIQYNDKKKAYQTSSEIKDFLEDLLKNFELDHISEISRIPEIFEGKSIASFLEMRPSVDVEIKTDAKRMIDEIILEYLSESFKDDPLNSIKFEVLHKEILEKKPELKSIPGDETEQFSRRLKQLQYQNKIIAPKDGFWKLLHPKMAVLSEKIHRKSLINRDRIWSLMEINDEVLAVIETKEELERLFKDLIIELGSRYSYATNNKDRIKIFKELGFRPEYQQYLNLLFTQLKEETVKEELKKKKKSLPKQDRRISLDEYLINSIITPLTNTVFPRLDRSISVLRQMRHNSESNLLLFKSIQPSKEDDRKLFRSIFENEFGKLYQSKEFLKSINRVMEAFKLIFESLRSRGYIKFTEINSQSKDIGHIIISFLTDFIEEGSLYICPHANWKILVPVYKKKDREKLHILCTRNDCEIEACSAFILPTETNLIIATEEFVLKLAKIWMEELIRLVAEHQGFQTTSGVMYYPGKTVLTEPTELDVVTVAGNIVAIFECKNKDLTEEEWKDWNEKCNAIIETDRNANIGIIVYTGKSKAKIVKRRDRNVDAIPLDKLPKFLEELWISDFTEKIQKR